MLTHETIADGHRRRVVVTRRAAGWEVRVERDNEVVRTSTYSDWHRVERAVRAADADASTADPHSTNR
jgi:hypothetical protein